MQALSSIAVVNGRPMIYGDALPALMLRAGHHVYVEIEGEGNAAVAVATLTRGGTGKTFVRRFSMADADRAGLTKKQGPWQSYPLRMLAMRARSWAIRDGAADALMGLAIADEAEGPDRARDVTPKRQRLALLPAQQLPRRGLREAPAGAPDPVGAPVPRRRRLPRNLLPGHRVYRLGCSASGRVHDPC
jgi:hypothetical protein